MSARIRRVLFLIALAVTALTGAASFRAVFSPALVGHPGNQRPVLAQFKIERGEIFAADGAVLATNEAAEEGYRRVYPRGASFASVTGYFDPIRGRGGLEAAGEQWLSGEDHFVSVDDWLASVTNRGRRGSDLTLTLETDLQELAAGLLRGRRGAIVALDPATGAIKAMAGSPSFDPNRVRTDWDEIAGVKGALVNRVTQSRYSPGSTFKIITAAAALETGIASPSSVYDGPAVFRVYGGKVTNFADQAAGRLPLRRAFAKSINTIFAQLGLELGVDRLTATARDFGVLAAPPFDLPVNPGSMAPRARMDKVMLAWSAVGQGETLVTPLQMALVAGGIAQRGAVYEPYLVEFVRDYEGNVRHRHRPRIWRKATSAKTAALVSEMMVETVASGTGQAAALPGVKVAGKTGTAEPGGGQAPHAWFVGFAPADDPKIALAVLVENGGMGGQTAAPLARALIERALNR